MTILHVDYGDVKRCLDSGYNLALGVDHPNYNDLAFMDNRYDIGIRTVPHYNVYMVGFWDATMKKEIQAINQLKRMIYEYS